MSSSTASEPSLKGPLSGLRVLLVVNKDWGFLTYRTPLARTLQNAGATVIVVGGATGREDEIRALGLTFHPVPFDRGSVNPLTELRTLYAIYQAIRTHRPDVVHNIAVKAALYGSIAALCAGTSHIVNSLTGLGYLFTSASPLAKLLRLALGPVYTLLGQARRLHYIFFNHDDEQRFIGLGYAHPTRSIVIPGSGVDTNRFYPATQPMQPVTLLMCARLLQDKGVREFVEAVRLVRRRGVALRAVVAGAPDRSHPHAISETELNAWRAEGVVELPGFVAEIPELLRAASIAVLPSYYGEGVPLFLLEALASGVPVITTNSPGCRDTVVDGSNGILIPPRDPVALADAIERLSRDEALRAAMGRAGRALAEERFAKEQVGAEVCALYSRIIAG
jgi:glycosyltransferase involved in cell wall biosynthesis